MGYIGHYYFVTRPDSMSFNLQKFLYKDVSWLCELLKSLKATHCLSEKDQLIFMEMQQFGANCEEIVSPYVTLADATDIFEFNDTAELFDVVIKPELDSISTKIAKWKLSGNIIHDLLKTFKSFLDTMDSLQPNESPSNLIVPNASPATSQQRLQRKTIF